MPVAACITLLSRTALRCASTILCDGCGQAASPEHVARRLQRLEWMTRLPAGALETVLLGAFSPDADRDFLYRRTKFTWGSRACLWRQRIDGAGKTEARLTRGFQRGGFFLAHVLECPLDESRN